MQYYVYLYLFSIICVSISLLYKRLDRPVSIILICIVILFVGFRYGSIDYFGYWSIYNKVSDSGLTGYTRDLGFSLLIIFEKIITNDFFVFIFLFSMISILIKYYSILKLSNFITLSIFIYISVNFFWKDLSQIRNGFAMGAILLSVYYSYNKKPYMFLLIILFSAQIHLSSLIGLCVYFIGKLKSKKIMLIMIFGSFFVSVVFGGIGHLIISLVPIDLAGNFSDRLHSYAGGKYDIEKNLFGISSILDLLLSITFVVFYDKLVRNLSINSVLIPLNVLGISLTYIFSDYGIMWGRINDLLFIPTLIILIPCLFELVPKQQRFITFFGILVYCSVGYFYWASKHPSYENIFQYVN